jgi:hypothetical protein
MLGSLPTPKRIKTITSSATAQSGWSPKGIVLPRCQYEPRPSLIRLNPFWHTGAVRGFAFGLILIVGLILTILSLRPGGIRRQLRFAARRFRIMLILGGIFLLGSMIIRLAFPEGAVADYGPPALAMVLAAVFLVVGRDPVTTAPGSSQPSRRP